MQHHHSIVAKPRNLWQPLPLVIIVGVSMALVVVGLALGLGLGIGLHNDSQSLTLITSNSVKSMNISVTTTLMITTTTTITISTTTTTIPNGTTTVTTTTTTTSRITTTTTRTVNNVQPIESPMRRPHPSSNHELSETESFMNDINTRTVHNYKRTRLNASKLHQQQPTITTSVHTSLNNRTHVTTIMDGMISIEAERFAQSRYPFPSFIIRFATPNIKEQTMAEDLRKHLKQHHQLDIEFVGYRRSTNKCSNNETDILLFVKDSYSFACLFDDSNWPTLLNGEMFVRSHKSPIPPQLSLIIKNVGLNIDW
ncbi:unnamed protein product, partial [Rotaria sordida]